jgi:uncharacterized Fe-S cluster protein YjdI/CDGSH-type Zn-finger protein
MSNKITRKELEDIHNRKIAGKEYSNGEVSVFWTRSLCIHSANCLTGLPGVFDLRKRPWIDMKAASTEEIIRVVNTCPTRALTFLKTARPKPASARKRSRKPKKFARIEILKDGPALIKGNFTLWDPDKKRLKISSTGIIALCRCGASNKKPFCDGSHKRIGFKDHPD